MQDHHFPCSSIQPCIHQFHVYTNSTYTPTAHQNTWQSGGESANEALSVLLMHLFGIRRTLQWALLTEKDLRWAVIISFSHTSCSMSVISHLILSFTQAWIIGLWVYCWHFWWVERWRVFNPWQGNPILPWNSRPMCLCWIQHKIGAAATPTRDKGKFAF